MADFPYFCIAASDYRVLVADGSRLSRADSGAPRIQRDWEGIRVSISLSCPVMTWEDYLSLLQFYQDNKTNSQIRFVDPRSQQEFLVAIVSPPVHTGMTGGRYYGVQIELEGVMSGNA